MPPVDDRLSVPLRAPAHGRTAHGHLPALDALRGLAIVLVLASHFPAQPAIAGPLSRAVRGAMLLGWTGVDLFFVLSGFLITGILLDGLADHEATGTDRGALLVRFYGRRALRILPLYYLTLATLLLVALALRATGAASAAGESLLRDQWWYWLHGSNLAAARAPHWASTSWVQHFWSLAVEEQFYLVWPLVLLALPRRWLAPLVGFVMVGALLVRMPLAGAQQEVAAYALTPARADALALGALLALAWRTPAWHLPARRVALLAAPAMALGIAFIVSDHGPRAHSIQMATFGHSCWALLHASLLWLAVCPVPDDDASPGARVARAWRVRLVRARWLRALARYSYGLYVVHIPVRALLEWANLTSADLIANHGFWIGGTMGLTIGIGASLAVAVPVWHLFESPILRRGGAALDARLGALSETVRMPQPTPTSTAHVAMRRSA